jgi:carbon monoxide dehydrogenase subunit G
VLLDVTKTAEVTASPQAAWELIRDVPRLTGYIPNVSDFQVLEEDRRYAAAVADKVGPFHIQVPVQIEVKSIEEPRRIVAEVAGNDSRGQARVRGTLEATVEPAGEGALLTLAMRMEVLGRLAALGAAPMRRRADEIFGEFVRRLQAQLGASVPGESPGWTG